MEAHERKFYTLMLGREPSEALVAKHDKALLMADRAGMGDLSPALYLLLAIDEADEEVMTAEPEPFNWNEVKEGTRVIAKWNGKERKGKFLEAAGRSETGKLRVKFDRDPQKKEYREIAQHNVRLA